MMEVIDIRKRFGKLQVLNGIRFRAEGGQCIGLVGPNGCGKSTLMKCILGMVIPDSGDIRIHGESILNRHEYRKEIGYMPQIGRYPEQMRIGQVIEMMCALRPDKPGLDEELIESFALRPLYAKRMNTLSGGTIQKVSAVLAFLFDPEILILDEPTAGLDPLSAEILKDKILQEKEKGKLILLSSHIISELDELVNKLIYIQDGELRFFSSVQALKEKSGEARLSRALTAVLKEHRL